MTFSTTDLWMALLESSTPEELAAFKRWLQSNPESINRFLEACAQLPTSSGSEQSVEIGELIASAMEPDEPKH